MSKVDISFKMVQNNLLQNVIWKLSSHLTAFSAKRKLSKLFATIQNGINPANVNWEALVKAYENGKDQNGNPKVERILLTDEQKEEFDKALVEAREFLVASVDKVEVQIPESAANKFGAEITLAELEALETVIDIIVYDDNETDRLRDEVKNLKSDLQSVADANKRAAKALET